MASIGRCGCTDGLYAVIAAQLLLFACARTHCLLREGPQGEVAGKTAGRRVGGAYGEVNRWNGVAEDPSGLLHVVVFSTNEKWETAENAS